MESKQLFPAWSREPLVHFFLIDAALFLLFRLVIDKSSDEGKEIVVSADRINQLASVFTRTWPRPPSNLELQQLVDDFVLEEIYYRQARAIGNDQDDAVILDLFSTRVMTGRTS